MFNMGDLPTQIGAYKMLGKLGEGGMGAVYEAAHETDDSRVAIKVLHREYANSEEFLGRFFNERCSKILRRRSAVSWRWGNGLGRLSDVVCGF
jgi:serine/threonine protein kinase